MAFINCSAPAYKTIGSSTAPAYAPSAPSSGLASLFGSLIGGTTPIYKTLDGQARQTPASTGLLRIFVDTQPSYKTAPSAVSPDLTDDGGDDADADDASADCPPPTDTVVLL